MPIFILFANAGVSFDGAFSLWVSLKQNNVFRAFPTSYEKPWNYNTNRNNM